MKNFGERITGRDGWRAAGCAALALSAVVALPARASDGLSVGKMGPWARLRHEVRADLTGTDRKGPFDISLSLSAGDELQLWCAGNDGTRAVVLDGRAITAGSLTLRAVAADFAPTRGEQAIEPLASCQG